MTSIRAIGCALPERVVTNEDLARANPDWNIELVAELTGVQARHLAADDETAFDLSVAACEALRGQPGVALDEVDAILYCTNDADYPMPGNAHLMHRHLGLGDGVLAFDYNLACSGFVYGVAIADSLARSGLASRVLLITAETQSKRMHPRDRSVGSILGDGAAATYITDDDSDGGRIVACDLRTNGNGFEHGYIPAGGARNPASAETLLEVTDASGNVRTAQDMHMDGTEVWAFVNSTIPGHIERFLAANGLGLDDVDLFVFHQASGLILDSLAKSLALPREKVMVHLERVGNLSSASIPFALRAALDMGRTGPGDRLLLSAFGVGLSYGSLVLEL